MARIETREEYQDRLRKEIHLQLSLPCTHCGMIPSISRLARFLGVDPAAFWRFVRKPGTSMLDKNLTVLARWLRMRGVQIFGPPKD